MPVGPAHLVGGERNEVGAHRLHVGGHVGHVLAGIDDRDRAVRVCRVAELTDRVDRAEHVGHRREPESLRSVEQRVEVGQVEQTLGRERHPAQDDAPFGGEDVPRHDVGVVLHVREHDDVTFVQIRSTP